MFKSNNAFEKQNFWEQKWNNIIFVFNLVLSQFTFGE